MLIWEMNAMQLAPFFLGKFKLVHHKVALKKKNSKSNFCQIWHQKIMWTLEMLINFFQNQFTIVPCGGEDLVEKYSSWMAAQCMEVGSWTTCPGGQTDTNQFLDRFLFLALQFGRRRSTIYLFVILCGDSLGRK